MTTGRCSRTPVSLLPMEDPAQLVYCSCPRDAAQALARTVVEQGLAACVNVLDAVQSVYRWQGELQQDEEALLLIKTRQSRLPAMQKALLAAHPYELPEIIAVPIEAGHAPYLQWIRDQTA